MHETKRTYLYLFDTKDVKAETLWFNRPSRASEEKERITDRMAKMRFGILKLGDHLEFVEMPSTYMYQLTALNRRLHKELDKLTAGNVPRLPYLIAECDDLELVDEQYPVTGGLEYVNRLESAFAAIEENSYPLISLLTEIRALQAQLEQWYEEETDQ